MQEETLTILRALKANLEELTLPIEAARQETYGEGQEGLQSGLDLIMSDLTMMVVMLINIDGYVAPAEVEMINDIRHVVYRYGIPKLDSSDYWEMQRQFLRIHPDRHLTLDHLPLSVRLLDVYDRSHGTEYAAKARLLFTQFADALIRIDQNETRFEKIVLENFKDILNEKPDYDS